MVFYRLVEKWRRMKKGSIDLIIALFLLHPPNQLKK